MKTFLFIFSTTLLISALWLFCFSTSPIDPAATQPECEVVNLPHHTYLPTLPDSADFCGEKAPLHRADVREALDREMLTNTFWHTNTILVLKRATRYFPLIEPILAEFDVPDDFKYLAVAESSLMPTVKSPAGAVGFWQIMEATGKELGMEINSEVDERYDVEKSTRAACIFLRKSYEKFGSWTLVAAAYNGGQRRVESNCTTQKQSSYYDVLWSEETSRYVFRILAFKEIMQSPEKYGYFLTDSDLYPADDVRTDTICTSISDLAQYAIDRGTTYKTLKRLNPWLRQNSLTNAKGKTYLIRLEK